MSDSAGRGPDYYDVFGHGIAVQTNDDALRERIAATLGAFRVRGTAEPIACFHLAPTASESRTVRGRQINTGRLLVIADRRKLITASLGELPWQIHIETFGVGDDDIYYYLLEPLLHMVLKRRGTIPWHGAALARANRGVLIVGQSGSGKSTAALSLLLSGYQFIADDELVLCAEGTSVRVRSIDEHLHYTDTTAALLSALPSPETQPLVRRGHGLKRRLTATVFGVRTQPTPVDMVIFPRVEAAQETRLQPLPAGECARRLLLHPPKEYPAVIVDPPSIEAHFDVCTRLAASARGFDLALGRGVERLSQLVEAAFE